ncbi:MAG: ATP-binding cassette domain-containing protein, partial [Elusimicrobiota bacterium]|nr:ATP-binding cassette domain-containing protein [Elusimicrobiota bacterium]
QNGTGKSSLLKIINSDLKPTEGNIQNREGVSFGYVEQIINGHDNLSGGEKFNKSLTVALCLRPNILLLDEPTNHLDLKNRKSLMNMIKKFQGAEIIVSHDEELLRNCINSIWHIDDHQIKIFKGNYDDYLNDIENKRSGLQEELRQIKKDKKEVHKSLMREQQRAKHSKIRGEKLVSQKRWLPAVGDLKKNYASKTMGSKNIKIGETKKELLNRLADIRISEILRPTFSLKSETKGNKTIVSISEGYAGYANKPILENINSSIQSQKHMAIVGNNGSGKTTLFKAILNCPEILKRGDWVVPEIEDIGYFDQNYTNICKDKTPFETIAELLPNNTQTQTRTFLNDFLFRKNEDVNKPIRFLSGGEKARLTLAKIAAKTPVLLLIDEVTNNIDLETKKHIEQVLREYPGTMMIISHDRVFLENIGIDEFFDLH